VADAPLVSIITATFNWSAALRCAIESARLQTVQNYEHLIIGDGCTDDSADVVASFHDPRLRWVNLPENSGGQAIPNNHGIALARGTFIAYLSHDDIWYPTHLATLIETLERTGAEMAGAVMIMYGPPRTGVRAVSGVFETGEFSVLDFMPPSSIMHTRAFLEKSGPWRSGLETRQPADVDFEQRARAAGARIVSSGELTVFKFNAASRRNAYRIRSADEQERMLARVRHHGDFRQQELIEVIRAVVADRYVKIEAPPPAEPGFHMRANARFKGTSKETVAFTEIRERMRFRLDDQMAGFEWYPIEATDRWGSARWSGPAPVSSLEFPVFWMSDVLMRVHVLGHMLDDVAKDLSLLINGQAHRWELEPTPAGTFNIRAVLPPCGRDRPLCITLHLARVKRPVDLGLSEDRRSLGICVSWVEFEPAPTAWREDETGKTRDEGQKN
jgi:hypothetical protein